ncbi:beta-propeller domain-containing protein [Archaeoglobus neptunius]|uniref:beta-propeller domain-containing protein n=1 Tax=Archaeoglobus neptunius TaxID=2798580 RepID=UPI0019259476|nr:beta-propeller domain-containing protein [Archaeoglobus neptunius]
MKKGLIAIMGFAVLIAAVTVFWPKPNDVEGLIPFSSPDEFADYFSIYGEVYPPAVMTYRPAVMPIVQEKAIGDARVMADRFSRTNVQVTGIDEPDIVKTDGRRIFVSRYAYRYIPETVPLSKGVTDILSALPPQNMSVIGKIEGGGNLLVYSNILMVLTNDGIFAYKIGETEIKELWRAEINGSLVDARLMNGKVYVVTRSSVKPILPCPIKPLRIDGNAVEIGCGEIYHPTLPVSVDTTYTVIAIDAENGKIVNSVSFVGSASHTVIYMSKNGIYVTYNSYTDPAKLMYRFVKENRDIFPDWVTERIEKLMGYDISSRAKSVEISVIIEKLMSSLGKDDRMKMETEYWNRWTEFNKKHAREIEKTYIARFSLHLEPEGLGAVPGWLLNQFSLDEYEGYLRVATTIAGNENDLYILDRDLNVVGSLQGFGLNERIYSVRFVGDKGYIVTFRQTDPFFVLNLSDPENPEIAGELKMPGFSSYLHPISDTLVLGIGRENGNVKISLFDVTNPEKPEEVDRYVLKEYWSDILNTHHAFLIDKKHKIFFLPAASGGYVFSYDSGITLIKAVGMSAKRAVYINDYLYIIGVNKIVSYDENSWKKVGEIELPQ